MRSGSVCCRLHWLRSGCDRLVGGALSSIADQLLVLPFCFLSSATNFGFHLRESTRASASCSVIHSRSKITRCWRSATVELTSTSRQGLSARMHGWLRQTYGTGSLASPLVRNC